MKFYRKMSPRYVFLLFVSFLVLLLFYRHPNEGYITNDGFPELLTSEMHRCSSAKKIAFMKTHKCASSTIENILFRYAYLKDLNLAMPVRGNYLSTTHLFDHKSVTSTLWGTLEFHIFTLHNRWNYQEVIRLMGNETRIFSVVRDPVDLFESLYGYMRMEKTFGVTIKEFVKLIRNESALEVVNRRSSDRFGRNQIAWDWGIQPQIFDNDLMIKEKLKSLDEQFELVLVAERLEESLVLLRHLLCWSTEQVTHLVLNRRKKEKTVALDPKEREQLKKWLRVDYLIYDHYVEMFEEKIRAFNSENKHQERVSSMPNSTTPMENEVIRLRNANSKLMERCVLDQVGNEKLKGKFRETNNDIMGYVINEKLEECHLYAMSEPAYLSVFRKKLINRSTNYGKRKKLRIDLPADN